MDLLVYIYLTTNKMNNEYCKRCKNNEIDYKNELFFYTKKKDMLKLILKLVITNTGKL